MASPPPPSKSPQPGRAAPGGDAELHRLTVEQLAAHPQLPGLRQRVAQKSEGVNKSIVKAGWMLKRKSKAGARVVEERVFFFPPCF